MKTWLALLLVAIMLPLGSPVAQSQDAEGLAPAPVALLKDTSDDVQFVAQGNAQSADGRWAAADLRALTVTESADSFAFTLAVGNLKASPEAPIVEGTSYYTTFVVRDVTYQVVIFRQVAQGAFYFTSLRAYDPGRGGYYTVTNNGGVVADDSAGTITATYARDLFVDTDGTSPMPEIPFTSWHVTATSNMDTRNCRLGAGPIPVPPQECPKASAIDQMPDNGNGTVDLKILLGAVQTGQARLSSLIPTRTSNGEATTFVYQVVAHNLADKADQFSLSNSNPPAGWEVKLPAPRIEVPAGGTVLFPVLLTTPFQHTHGTLQHFQIEMHSLSDSASVGRLQLGVRYAQPPQPAGHHSTLILHSEDFTGTEPQNVAFSTLFNGGPFTQAFMNAEPNDPNDAGVAVAGRFDDFGSSNGAPRSQYAWDIPLSPGLEMGLDFDLERVGELDARFSTVAPLTGAVLAGEIVHYSAPNNTRGNGGINFRGPQGDGRVVTVVATLAAAAPVDFAPNSQGNEVKLVVTPTPEGDYVAYEKGASLEMHLNLTYTGADPFFGPTPKPMLEPGGVMSLPLNEYHDQVDQVFASSTVALVAHSAQDRIVNPGKMALYNFTIENHGNATGSFNIELSGTHADWARILTSATDIRLDAGGSAAVAVVVAAPSGALQGEAADLVLQATKADDLNVRSLARLFTTVDTKADHPDDSAFVQSLDEQLHPKKTSPGLEFLPVIGVVALLALLRRRRA